MNTRELVSGNPTFVSISVFESLIQACQVRDGNMYALTGELGNVPIVLKVGDIEIPLEQVIDQINATASRSFDTAVAERVKEVVMCEKLDPIRRKLDDAAYELGQAVDDLNGTIGRLIQDELGPNSTWQESSGTC